MKISELIRKFKKNNSGVTLVELIVSVVILSITVGPLLFVFVYSTRVNAQSKIKQRCLNSAMSIMETFKANGLEGSYKLISGQVTETKIDADGNPVTDEDGHDVLTQVKFLEDNSATYTYPSGTPYGTYWIKNMTLSDDTNVSGNSALGSDKKKYDVKVEITKDRVTTGLSEIDVFDPDQDAVFEEYDENYGSYYYDPKYVATEIVAYNNIPSDDVNKVTIDRIIHLDLIAETSSAPATAILTYDYNYTLDYKIDTDGDGRKESSISKTDVYPDRSVSGYAGNRIMSVSLANGKMLRNVYFYYYPAYTEVSDSSSTNSEGETVISFNERNFTVKVVSDTLYINNKSNNDDVQLYIYKQADTSRSYYDLWASEVKYKLNLVPTTGSVNKTHVYDMVSANLETIVNENSTMSSELPSMLYLNPGIDPTDIIIADGQYANGSSESVSLTEAAITSYVYITVYDPSKDPSYSDPICSLESTMLN